jgi:hypothetical protein
MVSYVKYPPGVSPRGPPRTIREPLDSYGSYGGNRITLLLPQRKQVGLAVDYPNQCYAKRVVCRRLVLLVAHLEIQFQRNLH